MTISNIGTTMRIPELISRIAKPKSGTDCTDVNINHIYINNEKSKMTKTALT